MTKIACRARLVIHSRTATVLTVFSALSVVAFFTSSPAHATTYIYTGSGISIGASVTIDAAPDATGTFGATSESISGPVPIVAGSAKCGKFVGDGLTLLKRGHYDQD